MTTTSAVAPEIVRFAQGVRAALADLPAEEVDDLTEGLEADLAESLAEDLRRTLPDPADYAAELRLAAGLPGPAPTRGAVAGLADPWARLRTRTAEVIAHNPALASVAEFFVVLRPAWWIVRAWVAVWLMASFFGMEYSYWFEGAWPLVLVGLVVTSVQWGRGRWSFPALRELVAVGNVIAVAALFPVLAAADGWDGGGYQSGYDDGSAAISGMTGQGLSMNGEPLENVYPYDAAGNKLTGVQLFDVDGNPLLPNRDVDVTQVQQSPATLETGAETYNVYPLSITRVIWDEFGELVPDPNPDPDKAAAYANGPFLKVPAVQAPPAVAPEAVAQPNQ